MKLDEGILVIGKEHGPALLLGFTRTWFWGLQRDALGWDLMLGYFAISWFRRPACKQEEVHDS